MEAAARAHRIAVQSAGIGIALSLVAMMIAAVGWLAPVAGAVVQEVIDVAVILNGRGHVEIERHVRRLGRHLSTSDGVSPDQVDDLRATLYGLDAILTLLFAQEEEDYFTLVGGQR